MKKISSLMALILLLSVFFVACEQQDTESTVNQDVPDEVLSALKASGFNITDQPPIEFKNGYLVEGDIYLPLHDIMSPSKKGDGITVSQKQYSTNNLVATNGSRNITVFAREGGRAGFDAVTSEAIDLAIDRYNAENLEITFERVNSVRNADIEITRLNFFFELFGILGSAGFPTDAGDPFDDISLSGVLSANFGISTEGIATIVAHELGHCIGFRHTDFFDRSISCGGDPVNEGEGDVGANLIPDTPEGATLEAASWMLSCTDLGDRPFNEDDITALNFLY